MRTTTTKTPHNLKKKLQEWFHGPWLAHLSQGTRQGVGLCCSDEKTGLKFYSI